MKINPKQLQAAMQRMGVKQEDIDAQEVIIKTPDADLIIQNPHVVKVNMMGQESFQITGQVQEKRSVQVSEEDIQTVVDQTGASTEKAKEALEKNKGDIAQTILELGSKHA